MKYCVEISEEQLRIISVAVDEYMRLRMGQFEPLTEDLVFDGEDKKQLYEKPYDIRVYNERKHCIETMFEAAYKLAYPPFGHRERQHDSWGTCIDLVHAIEHQQWLDINVRHRAQQTGHLIPFHWGTNRSRKSRGWTNELSVLRELHTP